jgi:hypothetical protein
MPTSKGFIPGPASWPVAAVGKCCFIRFLAMGEPTDEITPAKLNRSANRAIYKLFGVWCGRSDGWDWYRVPLSKMRTVNDVAKVMRYQGLPTGCGPFWGSGRESQPQGQTKKPGSHSEDRHR